jgi:hypothetical protein
MDAERCRLSEVQRIRFAGGWQPVARDSVVFTQQPFKKGIVQTCSTRPSGQERLIELSRVFERSAGSRADWFVNPGDLSRETPLLARQQIKGVESQQAVSPPLKSRPAEKSPLSPRTTDPDLPEPRFRAVRM